MPTSAADVIGIPFYVWDMAERFARDLMERLRCRVRSSAGGSAVTPGPEASRSPASGTLMAR